MSIYLSEVFEYLDTHPVSQHPGSFETFLDMLHFIYTDSNPIDSHKIHTLLRSVDTLLQPLPPKERDQLYALVCELCLEYEQTAFNHGLTAGMHLMTELNATP